MCGLIYAKSLPGSDISKLVIAKFQEQRARGTDGFGFYLPEKDKLVHNTREGRTLNLLKREKPTDVLFHHRMPTSTENIRKACHPFSTKDFFDHNYVMIHNGSISNHLSLQKKHEKMGINYVSTHREPNTSWDRFNDSEALLWELALFIEGKTKKMEAAGAMAFIMVQMKAGVPNKVFFGRNLERPLQLHLGKTDLMISSTGGSDDIEPHILYSYDYKQNIIETKELRLERWVEYDRPYGRSYEDDAEYQRYKNSLRSIPLRDLYIPEGFRGYAYNIENRVWTMASHMGVRTQSITRQEYVTAMARHITTLMLREEQDNPVPVLDEIGKELIRVGDEQARMEKEDDKAEKEKNQHLLLRVAEYTDALKMAGDAISEVITGMDDPLGFLDIPTEDGELEEQKLISS